MSVGQKDLFDQLVGNTDKAIAILAAVQLDQGLAEMLKAKLVDSAKSRADLLFDREKPLDSLSAKIELSYRMGLVTKVPYNAMNLIRTIRNDFAHKAEMKDFRHDVQAGRIQTLFSYYNTDAAVVMYYDTLKTEDVDDQVSKFLACHIIGLMSGINTMSRRIHKIDTTMKSLVQDSADHRNIVLDIIGRKEERENTIEE